jgi:undecaprenyl-diphosphatase
MHYSTPKSRLTNPPISDQSPTIAFTLVILIVAVAIVWLLPRSSIVTDIDDYVLTWLGRFAHRSEAADEFITEVFEFQSVKLLPIVALIWGLWFLRHDRQIIRQQIVSGIIGVLIGFVCGRIIQDYSPYRPRPMHSGNSHFVAPYGANNHSLEHWSSFPSDHAVISFALATIVYRISRPIGLVCYVWATLVVCLPRLYGGLHYFSDVVAGALVGAVAVIITSRLLRRDSLVVTTALHIEERYQSIFYVLAFVFFFEVVTMFDDVRHMLSY